MKRIALITCILLVSVASAFLSFILGSILGISNLVLCLRIYSHRSDLSSWCERITEPLIQIKYLQ